MSRTPSRSAHSPQEICQWVGMLASAAKMQDQVSCIEVVRVQQEEPEQLEAHKNDITITRNKRLKEIKQSLNALGRQLEAKVKTVGGQVLLNPYSSPQAITNIESITGDLNTFANTLQLKRIHLHVDNESTWIQAAGKAMDDTGKALQSAGQQTAHIAQDAGNAIAKGAQDADTDIADGMQQLGKGIADGLKQVRKSSCPTGGARNKAGTASNNHGAYLRPSTRDILNVLYILCQSTTSAQNRPREQPQMIYGQLQARITHQKLERDS